MFFPHAGPVLFLGLWLLQQQCNLFTMTTVFPVSPCGPNNLIKVTIIPIEKNKETPMVLNINIPNWKKNDNCAININNDAPSVVQAPMKTETAISSNISRTRDNRSVCSDKVYPSAR